MGLATLRRYHPVTEAQLRAKESEAMVAEAVAQVLKESAEIETKAKEAKALAAQAVEAEVTKKKKKAE
jgi:hypothetical protein